MPLTFAQLKQAIIDNTKPRELCEFIQDTLISVNENELIDSGLGIATWVYCNGVVDDALLAEFNQANLNAKGVYSSGITVLNDPAIDIFVMAGATVTVNLTGNSRRKIAVMGAGVLSVNLSDNAYAEIKAYGQAELNVNADNNSIAQIEYNDQTTGDVIANDTTILHTIVRGSSNTFYTGNNSSFSLIKGFSQAVCNITQNDTSVFDIRPYNNSNLIIPPP